MVLQRLRPLQKYTRIAQHLSAKTLRLVKRDKRIQDWALEKVGVAVGGTVGASILGYYFTYSSQLQQNKTTLDTHEATFRRLHSTKPQVSPRETVLTEAAIPEDQMDQGS